MGSEPFCAFPVLGWGSLVTCPTLLCWGSGFAFPFRSSLINLTLQTIRIKIPKLSWLQAGLLFWGDTGLLRNPSETRLPSLISLNTCISVGCPACPATARQIMLQKNINPNGS